MVFLSVLRALPVVSVVVAITGLLPIPANAELHGRLPATPGGTDYRAYYDDVTDVTWLKDTNVPWTLLGRHLEWEEALTYGSGLNIGGISGWRLPNMDRNGDGVYVRCGPLFPDVTLEECTDNEFEALVVSNGFWANGVFDANGNGRIDEGEVVGDMGPFENFHPSTDFWTLNQGESDQFGNLYGMFYSPPQVDPTVAPGSYASTISRRLSIANNMQSWYVRSGDVLIETCDNGVDDDGDGLVDGDDPDCAEVCDNGIDDDGDGAVDQDDNDCIRALVRCYHEPIYSPTPGDTITLKAETISRSGVEVRADLVEIFLGTDKDNPAVQLTNTSIATLQISPASNFSYACRSNNSNFTDFSGWRSVAVGDFDFVAIPVLNNGKASEKIDIVFLPDKDEYTSYTDPDFIKDVGLLVSEGFAMPLFVELQRWFNFWIGTSDDANSGPDPNAADPANDLCLREPPSKYRRSYAFADSAGIVHRTKCRDNAGSPGIFTIETDLDKLQVVAHEVGHRPFGLADEYCCDGGYYTDSIFGKPPFPNLFKTESGCRNQAEDRGFNPDACRELFASGPNWWLFEPDYDDINPEPWDWMQQQGCASYNSNSNACSVILTPDIIGPDADPNGLYACNALMEAYQVDAGAGTQCAWNLNQNMPCLWLCRTVEGAGSAEWVPSRGFFDHYDVGASEIDRFSWFLGNCSGGGC